MRYILICAILFSCTAETPIIRDQNITELLEEVESSLARHDLIIGLSNENLYFDPLPYPRILVHNHETHSIIADPVRFNKLSRNDKLVALTHEVGHHIGLDHCEDCHGNIMSEKLSRISPDSAFNQLSFLYQSITP